MIAGLSKLLPMRRAALPLIAVLVFSACSSQDTRRDPAPVDPQPETVDTAPAATPAQPKAAPHDASASTAYGPLLDRAQVAVDAGDYEQGLALLERAQRIDPDSAEIYLAMARTHEARGDARQASAVAQRGLLYCSSAAQCDQLRGFVD